MSKTSTTVHLPATEASEHFAFHCDHDTGARSYRLTQNVWSPVTVYLGADGPDQLRDLAYALLDAADKWGDS